MTAVSKIKPADILMKHINKCNSNNAYAAKALLLSSIALDVYSNANEYYQIGKNKELKKEDKDYLQAYKKANMLVSGSSQAVVGLAVLSQGTQNALINVISKFKKDFKKNLNNGMKRTIMQVSTLVAAVVLTKRVIVPLIVTPLASRIKEHSNENNNEDNKNKQFKKHSEFENTIKYNEEENIFAPKKR